ncbi:hypothetical protein ABMA27_004300 [Loxostege sticticalis]|uniref:Regulatory protein zeste n=1 Tax=Loxostege sticticalis TaxID=481309 RepID=A0ABR3HN36_LOXSC
MSNQGSESMSSRHRSPVFSKNEVQTLVELVDKYKTILLNKATNNAACNAKHVTWAKLTKIFNSKGFKHKREIDCLRIKWDNLKKEARKANKNLLDVSDNEFDDLISKIVTMINEVENNTSEVIIPKELEDDEDVELEEPKEESAMEDEDLGSEIISGGENQFIRKKKRYVNRSLNFTPQECSLLLKCVRAEKKYVFCNAKSNATILLKNRAWARITNAFNKQSPNKRSLNVLRTKFDNMKRLGRKMGFMHKKDDKKSTIGYTKVEKDDLEMLQKIKPEPVNESDEDSKPEDDVSSTCGENDNFDELHNTITTNGNSEYPDPLRLIINNDSRIGLMHTESSNCADNKEISKLKFELLKGQLENTKLEKKRIEDAIRAEANAIEMRETEMALRLRAARLEAVAAAMKLPSEHPALVYTPEEARAQDYINNCQQT